MKFKDEKFIPYKFPYEHNYRSYAQFSILKDVNFEENDYYVYLISNPFQLEHRKTTNEYSINVAILVKNKNTKKLTVRVRDFDFKYILELNTLGKISNIGEVILLENIDKSFSKKIYETKINLEDTTKYEILSLEDVVCRFQILKNTEQNTFINFLSKNNLYFEYKDNYLNCRKLSNKKIFSIDNLYISNFSSNDLNYIMANINSNLNLIDLAYYSIRLLLPVQEDIEKEFKAALPEYKTKLFIAIFSIEKNVNYSNYALDDGDIAKIYGTTKNNIIETYKKRKVEQYEILRLGATCKAFGIKENDLLDIVKNYKLKKID